MLFGREAIKEEDREKATFEQEIEKIQGYEQVTSRKEDTSVEDELSRLDLDWESAETVDHLVEFLKQERVQVRTNNNRFNHSKCYIFDDSAVVGSSNFTHAGLKNNVELNAVLYQASAIREVREWFEKRWLDADDAKKSLIDTLEESKFGRPLEPFQMYIKLLYEYYRPLLEDLGKDKAATKVELTDFQADAVKTAQRIIKRLGGVIISDSTGLGKTHIGLALLRQFAAVDRKKVLLVAPKQVIDSVWEDRLFDESIKTRNVSLEMTGTDSFEPTKYLDYDVVLIDESHNYRSASTNRHNNIMKALAGGKKKEVVLMTATPVNNSLMDLYNQLSLVTAGDDAHFAELGISDLKAYFDRADRKQLASGVEDIVRLLDEIMVRRTRDFIKENYPNATLNDKKIAFPERKLTKVQYSLTALFGQAVYRQVIETIDQLHMVPYRVESYRITIAEEEKEEVEHRASLQKYGLLKRFESSVEAIRKSIGRLLAFYTTFSRSLERGKILDSKKFHQLMAEFQDEDEIDDDRLADEITKIDLLAAKDLEIKRMQKELREDVKLLQPLKESLDKMQSWTDSKLTALKELFAKDKVFETGGKKVVIFTQFVDTAKYVYEDLQKNLGKEKKILILTGRTGKEVRKQILLEFAPQSNNPGGVIVERQADILVSSEVLSEGQNLQDCNYAVNYDLPWNPMKIVQRVGRVDRLTSQYPYVTSAVFFPEKELEDELGLLVKLTRKIQKAAGTVGVESTILGEKESPKTFNAFERIKKEDATLLDDMERSAELLPMMTPFQIILSYLKKMGEKELKAVPYGKRSGKKSDESGLILAYREKKNIETLHLLYYDYKHRRFDHVNDVTWIFRNARCEEPETLVTPIEGFDLFRQLKVIDAEARQQILIAVNAPFEARKTVAIKRKYQKELYAILYESFKTGKVSSDEVKPVYSLIGRTNHVAWENEFKKMYEQYQIDQNIRGLIISLNKLFEEFKVKLRVAATPAQVRPEDLILVGCMFLVNPSFKDWNILT
jgi:superfamily II DNA or RNA helicase